MGQVYLKEANIDEDETLHSFRSGSAITLALSGSQLADVMSHVGWNNKGTALYYMKLAEVLELVAPQPCCHRTNPLVPPQLIYTRILTSLKILFPLFLNCSFFFPLLWGWVSTGSDFVLRMGIFPCGTSGSFPECFRIIFNERLSVPNLNHRCEGEQWE